MASVEPLDSVDPEDAARWLVVLGTLREADLVALMESVGQAERGEVTLDLLNLEQLTPGGCWTIRNLGDRLWHEGRQLRVIYRHGGPTAAMLRSSGMLEDRRIRFACST